jgi:hypothetical protein
VDTATEMSDRIDIYLRTVQAKLASLPSVEQRLAGAQAGISRSQQRIDRDDLRESWDLATANLEWLEEAYAAARMSEGQAEQYTALMPRLRAAVPVIRRLRLRLPSGRILNRAGVPTHPESTTVTG